MSSYADIEMKIVQWGEARGILPNQTVPAATLKMVSEVGELCDAIAKKDKKMIVDGVGDTMVTLIMLCALLDINVVDCMYEAYDEIKDRKGRLLPNGIFLKDAL